MSKSHLELAHRHWQELIRSGDRVIDATCGNGYDTCFLAKLPVNEIYSLDIQPEAIQSAATFLKEHLSAEEFAKITFVEGCHSHLPDFQKHSVRLIVYNLGYLPKGNKAVTTQAETTLSSLEQAVPLIMPGGAISITCYPGHPAGGREEKMVLEYVKTFDRALWNCCYHQWINRDKAPSLLILKRSGKNISTTENY